MTENISQSDYGDWINKIAEYENTFKKWESRVEKINKKYTSKDHDSRRTGESRFNILWSNVQILIPATFSRIPKPDVSRRYRDNDPVGRVASLILERALEYEIGVESDFSESLTESIKDRFLGGRGAAWVRYEPEFGSIELTEDADDDYEIPQTLEWERSPIDYVHWRDFLHAVVRTWEEVPWVGRRVYLDRSALIERFGEELGRRIPLDTTPEELKKAGSNIGNPKNSQALIYEIWDKSTREALWISKSLGEICDRRDDPLKLQGFWPCPKPLFATKTSDALVPTPDYVLYQDQARQLDTLSDRIDGLVEALKVRGVYDAAQPELARIFSEGENTSLIPVKNWAGFVEKSGLKGSVDLIDLNPIAMALKECYEAMEQIKAQVYEITGISDIVRGATDADETAAAQKIKSGYGNLRLKENQKEIARFASDLLKIKAQIICNFYSPDTIIKMSSADQLQDVDKQLVPQALELLKNDVMRCFRVDIEADSMVMLDEEGEQQARMQFLDATGKFIKEALPVVAQAPELSTLAMEMLKYGVTGFKVGKTLEGVIDQATEQVKQAAAQKQANPPPNPEMMKIQAKAQADQQQAQIDLQVKQAEAQIEMQIEAHRQQVQAQQVEQQNRLEAQRIQLEQQSQMQIEQMRQESERVKMAMEQQLAEARNQLDLFIARLKSETDIEKAEIAAQTTLDAAQIGAAREASDDA